MAPKDNERWLAKIVNSILYEMKLCWLFLGSDNIFAGMIPGLLATVVVIKHQEALGLTSMIFHLLLSFIYFWLYMYSFTIANQIIGLDEDRINKPDRPIVTNFVSISGAKIRLLIVSLTFIVYASFLGIGLWAAIWVGTHLWYNKYGHYHWITKNFVMMWVGTFVMLVAGWEIVRPMNTNSWKWALYVATFVLITNHIQDFRDIEGDREIGRKTLPIVFNERKVRLFTSAIFLLLIPVSIWLISNHLISSVYLYLFSVLFLGLQFFIALRLIIHTDPKSDGKTYTLYCYLFSLYVIGGVFLNIQSLV